MKLDLFLLFVCLFVCLFVYLVGCLFVCLFVCLFPSFFSPSPPHLNSNQFLIFLIFFFRLTSASPVMKFQRNTLVTLKPSYGFPDIDLSLEFWLNASDTSSGSIIARSSPQGLVWEVAFCNGGALCFKVVGGVVASQSSLVLSVGTWYHVIVAIAGNPNVATGSLTITWFINGVQDSSNTATGELIGRTCGAGDNNPNTIVLYDATLNPASVSPFAQGFTLYTSNSSLSPAVYGVPSPDPTAAAWRVVDNTTSSGYLDYQKAIPGYLQDTLRAFPYTVTAVLRFVRYLGVLF